MFMDISRIPAAELVRRADAINARLERMNTIKDRAEIVAMRPAYRRALREWDRVNRELRRREL